MERVVHCSTVQNSTVQHSTLQHRGQHSSIKQREIEHRKKLLLCAVRSNLSLMVD